MKIKNNTELKRKVKKGILDCKGENLICDFDININADIINARNIIKGNTTENFIVQTLKRVESKSMKTTELRELVQSHYGVGRTQSYDRIKALREEGLIELAGRETRLIKVTLNGKTD